MTASKDTIRRQLQIMKELPPLATDVQRIISACENPEVDVDKLANILNNSPTIAARILGLANSAFFGQQGKVRTLSHAIMVLGMVTVRSIAMGLAMSGIFSPVRCRRFQTDRYWLTAIITATMAQDLVRHTPPQNPEIPAESVYMAGLLHNIGLFALVHLIPNEMEDVFAAFSAAPGSRLKDHLQEQLGIDHYQAGLWLGSKWHLPRELLLVMEHHYQRDYRDEQWPLVLMTGLCARWATCLYENNQACDSEEGILATLGIVDKTAAAVRAKALAGVDSYRLMAELLTGG